MGPADVPGPAGRRTAADDHGSALHGAAGPHRPQAGRRHHERAGRGGAQGQAQPRRRAGGRRQGGAHLRRTRGCLRARPRLQPQDLRRGGARPRQTADDVGRDARRREDHRRQDGKDRIRADDDGRSGRLDAHRDDVFGRRDGAERIGEQGDVHEQAQGDAGAARAAAEDALDRQLDGQQLHLRPERDPEGLRGGEDRDGDHGAHRLRLHHRALRNEREGLRSRVDAAGCREGWLAQRRRPPHRDAERDARPAPSRSEVHGVPPADLHRQGHRGRGGQGGQCGGHAGRTARALDPQDERSEPVPGLDQGLHQRSAEQLRPVHEDDQHDRPAPGAGEECAGDLCDPRPGRAGCPHEEGHGHPFHPRLRQVHDRGTSGWVPYRGGARTGGGRREMRGRR